ncbi:hypothetical protein BMR1_02g00445 [Babesia microti strain RI]|uniref:30S ribosomal protein S11 n=1 Tax=Babesia microti (strain RI) TaxID=1133968 RepID=I7IPV6_BABMR|nr:hypothetical protein BMR1_02g00445 [Babesia microti strain RI]CCF73255.1 hypothetical protein BMR1_02g00445 [Babesia microti strain RI]|eukprot:XP_012647864.1 hypothetical protein BMR1_02g00445 [Babesia microti strain RI]
MNRIQGSVLRMRRMAGRPEFHSIDRDRHGHIIEPTDVFMLVLTTSKNNVHAQIVDRSKNYKTIFGSFAGNVGFHKAERKTERCAYRIGENIARKCRRLGIFVVDIKFRRVMRIDAVLQAIQALGLKVRQLIHEPKIPKTSAHAVRPRRRRRV